MNMLTLPPQENPSPGPCHPKVKTQLTLNDLGKEKIHKSHEVTQTQLEQDVVTVNPDINSMESRG